MARKRILMLPLLIMTLLLAGCYRQAEDSFQPANNGEQPLIASPTDVTLPLDASPTPAGEQLPGITEFAPTESTTDGVEVTSTLIVFTLPTQTATQAAVATNTTQPNALGAPTSLPTATPPTLITPELGGPSMVTIASPTAGAVTTQTSGVNPALDATPTDLAVVPQEGAECTHTVANGENLFRIAVQNDVALQDLLIANNLTEQAIIQPGQVLIVPNCTPGATVGVPTTAPVPGLATPTGLPANSVVHTVGSGDTLTTIARRYGVSIQAIVDANELLNPDRLDIGQQLVIPQ